MCLIYFHFALLCGFVLFIYNRLHNKFQFSSVQIKNPTASYTSLLEEYNYYFIRTRRPFCSNFKNNTSFLGMIKATKNNNQIQNSVFATEDDEINKIVAIIARGLYCFVSTASTIDKTFTQLQQFFTELEKNSMFFLAVNHRFDCAFIKLYCR